MQNRIYKCLQALTVLSGVLTLVGAASGQVNLTSPAAAVLVGSNISMAGTGYPAGTISPASVNITVTPSAGNGSPVSFSPSTVTGAGSNRNLIFKLPPSLSANLPYTAKVCAAGQTTSNVAFTTATCASITINPAGSISNVSPGAGQQGTAVSVTIAGLYTHFGQATSVVSVGGTGVTPSAVVVNSPTKLTATFTIAANATIGVYPVTVTTGAEVATLPVGFVVTATPGLSFSLINPGSAPQGTSLTVDVQGLNTEFVQGTTTANFGDGITVTSILVNTPTDMTVGLSIDPLAPPGSRMVTVVTGGQFAVAENGFTVTSSGASIISATPATPIPQGGNATLTLTGVGTHWVPSGTTVSFGGGINTGSITVNSNTSLTVNISVGPGVPPGVYGVTTTTNGEIASLGGAVTVSASTPFISGVAPTTGAQGANSIDVIVNGTYTNFLAGTLSANFGSLITVNKITASSATSVDINISIAFVAALGGRSVTLTSNGTLFSFNFSVTPDATFITNVTPNSGLQQSSYALQVTGLNTHWFQGTTTASLGDNNITINRVIVNSPTSAEVDITLGAQAGLGLHSLTMTTGGENETANGVFRVLPFTPSLSLAPSSGMIGTTVTVNFNGNFTHFSNQTLANIDGEGVQIQSFTVPLGSQTTATAKFVIDPNAPSSPAFLCTPGNRTVTLTTGNEIVTAPFCVTSTPAVLTSITPSHSPQNNNLTVAITGQFTHFTSSAGNPANNTTVGFGPDITPSGLVINSATSLTLSIAIDPVAALGWRQAFVNTGAEQLTIGFLIDAPGSASLVSVSPSSGQQGQTISGVTITGNLTNFTSTAANPANDTIAILGAGITVSNLQILSSSVATATISISSTTSIGARTVEMITGAEDVAGTLFSVGPGIAAITFSPNCNPTGNQILIAAVCTTPTLATVQQGGIVPFNVTGTNTHFLQGETTMSFGGSDIAVTQLTVNSPTSITGQIAVSYTATIGFRSATATTDGEVAITNSDALNVIQTTSTSLNITPTSGLQGTQHLLIQMNGSLTNWINGNTTATFGNNNGLVVNSVNVTSATQAVIDLTIQGTAYVGLYSLTVTTNHSGNPEQESLTNVFSVGPGAAIITVVAPPSGAQGQTESVAITGQNTSWQNGVTTAYFTTGGCVGSPNPGISAPMLAIVTSATSASLPISIFPTAQTGLQTLCMATLGELVNFQNAFTITAGTPTLNGVTPVNAEQGVTAQLNIIGQFTHFVQGTTTITFGEGITLTSPLTITSPTAATANIAVSPLADLGTRNVVLNTPQTGGGDEIVQGTAFFTVIAGPAILSSISPSTGNQGTHILMQVNGENTHWAQGLSQVTINGAGYDITINGVQVQSPTTLVIDMNISPTANLGVRTVYVSTGGENVTLQNGFLITGGIPSISGITPSSAQQGSNNLNVQISGIFTKWDNTTLVSFGPNITFGTPQWTVNSNTSITAVINIPNGAPLGLQTVTVQTGGQVLTTSFNILSNAPPTPYISYEYPSVALVGQTLSVNLAGQYTHWLPGTTQITFGAGITVNNFQVTGENSAIANITIIPTATLGQRTVTMTTGAEVENTNFTVTVGTPAITMLSPNSIIQGQTLDVDVIGQYTTFSGSTIFSFGQGITINTITLFGPTAARLNISAGIEANLGGRSVSETTGAEVAFNQVGFSVTPSQATITQVTPNTAPQGTTPVINVTGFATNWVQNTTIFSVGGIGITNVVVNSPTSATLTLSIAALASTGEYSISATTGGEFAFLNNAFVVTPGTPILVSATGANVQQGMAFTGFTSVGVLGQLTSFVNGVTTVNLGNGVNVTGVTVTSADSLSVSGSVSPLAFVGSRNITVTTGAQQLVLFGAFFVSPGTAQITQLSPNTGNQGQTMNVAITGTNTNFTQNVTVANFGQGISVNTLTINSLTSATANITVAANAIAQQNSVTLTTLGESATAVNAFTIVSTTPIIDFINPTFLSQGQTGNISITGSFTNWVNGNTVASFGAGVQVNSTTVTLSNAATANITVSPSAAVGTRTVQMTTNLGGGSQEVAIKANAFTISNGSATITSATPTSPATVHQGDTDDTIVVVGSGTHFDATSLVAFCNGITPVQINLNSPTQLTVIVNVAATTAIGACGATVTTGGEIATGVNLFNVLAGLPIVTSVNPVSAHQNDQNVNVTVNGLFTHWVQGTTTANFGAGITVNLVTVSSSGFATVNITVSAAATIGNRSVTMTTGAEVAPGNNIFAVLAGVPQLTSINPVNGAQNSTQTVTVNGLFTNFVQGTSIVTFNGGNVTAGVAQVNGPTQLTVSVTVAPGATATARTITVTTGAEIDSLANAFTVLPGAPTITQISPNVGVPNTPSLQVTITGLFTNWVNGTTTANFGPDISVGGAALGANGPVNVTSPTTAIATISIDNTVVPPTAREVTVNGPPSIVVNNGFTIQSSTPTAPTVISVSPTSGATAVPLNSSYTVVFNSPINPATVLATNSYLSSSGCNPATAVPVVQNVDASGRILTLTPSAVLAVGQSYDYCLNENSLPYIKDPSGNTISGNAWSFTTGFATSNTGPTFLSGNIINNDINVGTNVTPIVGFDKAIDPATQLAGLTIFAGATPVAGTWSYNATFTQAIFTPAGGFAAGTLYTLNLNAALTDTVGNPLVNPTIISFTTGAGADTTLPTLLSSTPITGSITGESPTFRLVFSKEMNPLTVTAPGQYYVVNNVTNQTLMGTVVTASADRKTFTLTLSGPLNPSTQYYWNCGTLRDQAGHNISPGADTFTTGTAIDLTAPVVTQVSPPNNQTGVPVNAPVEILLSKAIDPTTVNNSDITLTPAVAGAVALSANGLTMTFTPAANLATSQAYTVNVAGFADLNGNLVTPFSSSFTASASPTPDTTHGTITMVPTSGSNNVATNASVVFTFNKIYDPATVSYGGNVRLYDSLDSTYIAGTLTLNAPAFTTVTFTPSTPLEPNHTYCGYGGLPFTGFIYDLAGNSFSNYVNSICFTTANGADTTPPTVISVIPLNNATGIGPNNPVIVTFSKSMNPSTLTTANVAIYEGINVYTRSFNVSFDATTVVFNAGNLPWNTTFTVVVTPNVADLAGNQLAAQFTSTFTTMPQPVTTVPTVTAIHPAAGATGVPVNAAITLFISEPLNTATVPGALNVSQNGVLINGNITYGSNNQVVVFTPNANFVKGASIEVFFTPSATDNSGNPLTNYMASFTVAPNLSATPATLISTTPSEDVTGVVTTTVVELQFSKPINTATVNAGSFFLKQNDTTPITGSYTFLNNNTVLRFTPNAPLAGAVGNTIYYRVHYENTILDTDGLAITGAADNTWYFYVGTVSNTTPPSVTLIAPTNNATGIGTNSTIRVTFSEPVDQLTISPSTLTLVSNAAQIPYNASFDSPGTTLTIVPQAAFPASSVVTVGLTSGITDSSGNPLTPFSPVFTTGPTPDFVRPTVISSTVSESQTNVPLNSVFTLTFSKPIDTRTEVVNSTVYLYDNVTGYVPITLSFSPDGTQVTVQPLSPLGVNRSMYVYVCSVQDLDGNAMNACAERDFTTALVASVGGPQVTYVLPPSGFQVPTNFLPAVQFNRPIDLTSLGGITLQQGGSPVAFTIAGSVGNTVLNLSPNSLLAPNLPFTLTIAGVKDTGGNTMAGSAASNFTTGPSIDLVPPTVTSITPESGETTGTNPVLRITFNEPINPLKSNPNWSLYNNVTGVHFPGAAIAASADLKSQTVTYPGNLDPNTQYCWSAGVVYDLAANSLSTPTPCFTTSSGAVNTAPTVTSVTPPNSQVGVPIDALIQITLSSPIDATSVKGSSLTLTPAAPAGSTVSLSLDGFTMTLSLGGSTLANNTSYSVNASGFRDVNGNTVTAFSSSFTTSAFNDNTHGTISLTSPAPGSFGISINSAIQATLSKAVDPNSVIANTFEVYANNNGSQRIPGTIAISNGGSTLTFTPIGPMPPSTPMDIYVGVTASLLDLAGNTFTGLNNAIFMTASTPDTTPPTVISVTPTNGATNVGPNAVVTLIFSKALNNSTVNAQNVTLFNGFTNLGASVSISSDDHTVTLTTTLPYSATLTVAVNTSVQDLDGNKMANPFSSTFTTETQPLTALPTVTVMRPANGATGVLVNDTITLFFSAPMSAATVPGAFYVSQNGTLLTGSVVPSSDGRSAVWTGPGFLNSAYVQVFFAGATDTSGNVVTNYSASFTTAANTTATPATLVSTVPPQSSQSVVNTNTVIEIQFSKPINPATVSGASFYVVQQDTTPVNGTITMLNNNTVLRFTPSSPLAGAVCCSIYYRVHYENSIQDVNNLPISGSADNTWYFYMAGTGPSTTIPTVTSFAPYNGATGVGDNATIRLTFNELMDTLTIDPATVTLMNGATSIPFSLSFGGSSFTTVTLSPYAPLPVNATLTLALSGITDTSNNTLAPQSISFQTGAGADFSKPFVIYSSINSSTPAIPLNSTFTVIFNKPLDRNTVNTACAVYSLYNNNLGCTVGSTVTVSPDGTTITYVPTAPLPASANLELYATNATDLDGNTQTNFVVNFFTGTGTVTTPPVVLTANPASGATGAPLNSSIEAQFGVAVSGTSLSQVTLMKGGTPVPFTASLIYADTVVHLTPASLLLPNTTYTVSLTGVQDVAGNTMTGTYSFSFTTGTNVDVDENATPNVVSTIANGLPLTNNLDVTAVPDNPTIVITLDTPVEPASLYNGALVLYLNSNTNITYPLNIALSADQKTITVTLAPGTLAAGTEYQFRVGYNYRIRDWAGSDNGSQFYQYYFTTQ